MPGCVLLWADNLHFAYGASTPVLSDVSFRVPQGGMVGLIGPNGSGKTTTMKLLAGTLTPTSGRVLLDGQGLRSLPRRLAARRVAVVPQDTHLAFDFTVLEVALMGRHPYLGAFELEGPEDVALAMHALAQTSSAHLAPRSFATLSGGERQRVVIASALAQFEQAADRPVERTGRVLLLDEPTASLDLHHQLELTALLRRLNCAEQLTIVVSTHDLSLAAALCDQLILLRDGRLLDVGPIAKVLTRDSIRDLYGVDADVQYHEGAGHLTVVPIPGGGSRTANVLIGRNSHP